MGNKIIKIKDFSTTPGSRYKKEGRYSAEGFLEEVLEKEFLKIQNSVDDILTVDLDGTFGYATSFLEEVFGGMARKYGADNIEDKINVVSSEEKWLLEDINGYIKDVREQE